MVVSHCWGGVLAVFLTLVLFRIGRRHAEVRRWRPMATVPEYDSIVGLFDGESILMHWAERRL